MTLEKSEALVLRSVAWSETSLVVTLWTRDFGKISAIAKGARRLKSPFESALDLLSFSSVVFLAKSGDSLDVLTEAKLQRRFRSAQRGLLPLYCGYYVAELTHAMTENHQPVPGLMDGLLRTLVELDSGKCPASTTLRFELHTLRLLGLLPSFQFCVGCGEEIETNRPAVGLTASGGGVVCSRCSPSHRQILRIDTQTLQALKGISELGEDEEGCTIPVRVRTEVRFVMEHILGHVCDRRLRLLPFLEELKR
jgi:DNA repair protein RecO (recombination protein O)